MKITKYGHACLVIEDNGTSLIVDPGSFSKDLVLPESLAGIVITHEHGDHYDIDQLNRIHEKFPVAPIIAHEDITSKLESFETITVSAGDTITVSGFTLEFFGGTHAVIYPTSPNVANLGVMVNGRFYYPGDSFTTPEKPVEILAIPVSAPWLKMQEVIDFMLEVKPEITFPTHDALLSDIGNSLPDNMLAGFGSAEGIKYIRLDGPTEF